MTQFISYINLWTHTEQRKPSDSAAVFAPKVYICTVVGPMRHERRDQFKFSAIFVICIE